MIIKRSLRYYPTKVCLYIFTQYYIHRLPCSFDIIIKHINQLLSTRNSLRVRVIFNKVYVYFSLVSQFDLR